MAGLLKNEKLRFASLEENPLPALPIKPFTQKNPVASSDAAMNNELFRKNFHWAINDNVQSGFFSFCQMREILVFVRKK